MDLPRRSIHLAVVVVVVVVVVKGWSLTERVEQFGGLSSPERLVVFGDDVVGLVLVHLRVEGHLVQEGVHLDIH